MINSFSVKNYKSLSTEPIKLAPLTILSGINNAGKTTFIQSILELSRYHYKNKRSYSSFPILSNYKTKVLNNDNENKIKFFLQLDLDNNDLAKLETEFTYNEKAKGGFISSVNIEYNDFKSKDVYKLSLSKGFPTDPYKISSYLGLSLLWGNIRKDNVELPKNFEGYGDFEFIGFMPLQCSLLFKENPHLEQWFEKKDEDDSISLKVNYLEPLLKSILDVKYIGPLRHHPKEFYFFETRDNDIDSLGENTFEVLDRKQNNPISYYKALDESIVEESLLNGVNYWLNYFYEGARLELKSISDNLIQVLINNHTINNSGFGFSQILPIIVQALLLKNNELLLLEQPEIHLHPELEYKLAYFLLCITKNKRQVIAETHSEHMINQLIISKMENKDIEEQFKIYFFEKEINTNTEFNLVAINEFGEIKDWPKGFFDQYLDFSKKLIALRKEIALRKSIEKEQVKKF